MPALVMMLSADGMKMNNRCEQKLILPGVALISLIALLCSGCAAVWASAGDETIRFSIPEGSNSNYFIYSPAVSGHVLITDAVDPRIIIATAAGNSGMGLWFDRLNPANTGLQLKLAGEIAAVGGASDATGLCFNVETNKSRIVLTGYILDSIRQVRNYGTSTLQEVNDARNQYSLRHPAPRHWREPGISTMGTTTAIRRSTCDNREYVLELRCRRGKMSRDASSGGILFESGGSMAVSFSVKAVTPFRPLTPYQEETLFLPELREFHEKLEHLAKSPGASAAQKERYSRFSEGLRNLRFLSYREKFLAGSWRFMTYFGRDTILSLMMLSDITTPGAFADGMQSVIDRLSPDGEVAHEEDIGSWAEFRNVQAALKSGTAMPSDPEKPCYDYKMVDGGFLFPPMQARYLLDPKISRAEKRLWLEKTDAGGEKNLVVLARNWNHVLKSALPFAAMPEYRTLVRLKPGETAGDWRDSAEGLGRGVYPGGVNVDLVCDSIAAIGRILETGIFSQKELELLAKDNSLTGLEAVLREGRARQIARLIECWKGAKRYFAVSLDAREVRERLQRYLENGVSDEERNCLLTEEITQGIILKDFVYGDRIPGSLRDGISFYALSLDDAGNPVEIMNSDFSFTLFLGEPSPGEIEKSLRLLELPYPIGLKSSVGVLVANPAFSRSPAHWKSFDRRAYHGTVVWGFQTYMLELGIARQIARFEKDPGQKELVAHMQGALRELGAARERVGSLANSELWTFAIERGAMVPSAFGVGQGSITESNAVQLWSSLFPAVLMKEYQLDINY